MAVEVTPQTDIAEAAMFHGALVSKSGGSNQNASTGIPIAVDYTGSILYDTDNFFVGPTEFIIPEGVQAVKLKAQTLAEFNSAGYRQLSFQIDTGSGYISSYDGLPIVRKLPNPVTTDTMGITSPVLKVEAGYKFRVLYSQDSGVTLQVLANKLTWFSIEVIKAPFGPVVTL